MMLSDLNLHTTGIPPPGTTAWLGVLALATSLVNGRLATGWPQRVRPLP